MLEFDRVLMRTLKAGLAYFALAFAAGFVSGCLRASLIAPHGAERIARLMEVPMMSAASILAARWVVRRFALRDGPVGPFVVGFVVLGTLLVGQFIMVLGVRGLTLGGYVVSRDSVAGVVYMVTPGLFAAMPLLVARR